MGSSPPNYNHSHNKMYFYFCRRRKRVSLFNDTILQNSHVSNYVTAILQLLSDNPIDAEVRTVVEEMKVKRGELRVKRERLGLVRSVVEVNQRLESLREGLKELKVALRVRDDDNGGRVGNDREPWVYELLRREWSQRNEG